MIEYDENGEMIVHSIMFQPPQCTACGDMGLVYLQRGDGTWDAFDCPACFPAITQGETQ